MINVICSMAVFLTNYLIGFFLSPYIVAHIGVEANGFVTLANNFVMYAQLIVTALNSMAARYITLAYAKKEYKKANLYYNSVFWGNLAIVALLILPALYFIVRMETMLHVPNAIVTDVKLLFSFIFFNFFLSTGMPNWDCGTYVTNRLDLSYIPQVIAQLFRCLFLCVMFTVLLPHVWYVGMAASIVTVICLICNGYNTHRLTPELKIHFKNGKILCSVPAVKELVGAGIWNSVSSAGIMLLNELDLIICNLFISSTAMGILSLAKILPNYLSAFSAAIRNAFAPEMTIHYAQNNMKQLLKDINRSCKMIAILLGVPLAGIIVMGEDFFRLWVPSQDARLLSCLSAISCAGYAFTSGTQMLYNVFPTVNRVKPNAILMLLSGLVSTGMVFLLLKTTSLGIYAIAGVSVVINFIRNMLYTVPYAASYLGFKKTQFFPQVGLSFLSTFLVTTAGAFLKSFFVIETWPDFLLCAALIAAVGYTINIGVFLNREEKKLLWGKVRKRP